MENHHYTFNIGYSPQSMNLSPRPAITTAKETVLSKNLPKPVFLIHHLIISKLCFNNCTFQTERKNEASCVTYDIAPLLLKHSVLLEKYMPWSLRLTGISRPVLCLRVNLSLSSISASKYNFIITQLISVFLNLALDWGSLCLCLQMSHFDVFYFKGRDETQSSFSQWDIL